MKASDFVKHLKRIEDVIEAAIGRNTATNYDKVVLLCDLFKGQESKQVKKILEQYSELSPEANYSAPTIESIKPVLKALQNFINGCATNSLKTDIGAFIQFLESYKYYSIDALLIAAVAHKQKSSSARKTSAKRNSKLDKDEIIRIIQRLKDTIGDPDAFVEAYETFKIEDLSPTDVRAIAKGIYSRTPSNASKRKSISLIKARHEDLVKYHNKSKSMSGRTAA